MLSNKPIFLEGLLETNVNDPLTTLKILQKNSFRTSRIEMIFENIWFKKQPREHQEKVVLFMIHNNMNIGIIDTEELAKLVVHLIKHDHASPHIPLILRKMSSTTAIVGIMVENVTRIKTDQDREWFCQLIEHVCDISIDRIAEAKLYIRTNQIAHYSSWYDLFDKCEDAPQFLKMCQIHSKMMVKLNMNGTYRVRMVKKLHVTMFVEMFYSNLQKENYVKVDIMFSQYMKHVRNATIKFLKQCDGNTVRSLLENCQCIAMYLRRNRYKLQSHLDAYFPWQLLDSNEQTLVVYDANDEECCQVLEQLANLTTANELKPVFQTVETVTVLYKNLLKLTPIKQKYIVSLVLALANQHEQGDQGLPVYGEFLVKYVRYILRLVGSTDFENTYAWYRDNMHAEELNAVSYGMVLSTGTHETKRDAIMAHIKQANMSLVLNLLKKFERGIRHSDKKPRKVDLVLKLCNKQARILLQLTLDCTLSDTIRDELTECIEKILAHTASLLLVQHSAKHLRHLIFYSLFNSWAYTADRCGKQQGSAPAAAPSASSEPPQCCSICIGTVDTDSACCKLPCSHVFHSDCLCSLVQHNITTNNSKLHCPYCKSDVVETLKTESYKYASENKKLSLDKVMLLKLVRFCKHFF
jgi:hypothetical protein